LCNKSYSRHPEYEAHIGSYDHQHRKRLQDLKQLSRDPNAAEKARRAERKADAEAGLKVIEKTDNAPPTGASTGGGFKKGGFKSSFAAVKGSAPPSAPVKRNVLGDEEDTPKPKDEALPVASKSQKSENGDVESDTDEEYGQDYEGYYDPRQPTGCYGGCASQKAQAAAS
jgi:hypothetical protein